MGENYISCQEANGSINISEDVISSMVRSAITEVEGVAGLANTAGAEIAELIGIRTLTKGVKVQFVEGKIVVDTIITVSYGSNVVKVARAVQEKVLTAVQTATGIEDAQVNVHVTGIAFEK
ncbi:MAG: Asp23/Gls24 family envelope stress response protein [Oscillospiraceae bacterium]|nr:Asp23/Gls24 family envelope stress response protein [Oscillospiraceae bacterium]